MNRKLIAALFTVGLASAMPAAIAQTASPQTKGPQASHARQDHHAKHQLPSERIEARLAYIQMALKITDAQKPQWETFAATLRKQAREADKRVQERRTQMADRSKQQNVSAIERLERRQRMMAARVQHMNELIAASKPLYATLNPDQKLIADGLLSPRNGKGGHKGHHGSHGNA
jgi:hypothetical protein